MISLASIYTGGILTLLMAIFHIRFPKIFEWEKDYDTITVKNKKIFHTIHLALLLMFFIIGLLSLFYAQELSNCQGISFGLNILISLFWLWRTIWQLYYFKGKTMHFILVFIFSFLFLCYLTPIIFSFV